MPRSTHPYHRGRSRGRAWRIERTAQIVRTRRARIASHIDRMHACAPAVTLLHLGDYLQVRGRRELDAHNWTWEASTPNPFLWLRLRQVADFAPAPAPPLCRCPLCRPPLPEWAPDLRHIRRVEHGAYDRRDGDPRWVPAERTGELSR